MAQSPTMPPRPGRGRRPAAEVRSRVLDAAGSLLRDEGLHAVTFDRVAALAGSSKTTLYKWWASPGSLAAEAYFSSSREALEFRDTGDIVSDVCRQLRAFIRLLTETPSGRVIAELIGAAQSDPELSRALSERYTRPRRELAGRAIAQAKERGQLLRDADAELLIDQLWGACYARLLIPDNPLPLEYADALVGNVLLGAATATYRMTLQQSAK